MAVLPQSPCVRGLWWGRPALRGSCGIWGVALGPNPSLGPGKGTWCPPSLERKAGASLAGGGRLLLTHRRSAVFPHQESVSQKLPDPTATGLDVLSGTEGPGGGCGHLLGCRWHSALGGLLTPMAMPESSRPTCWGWGLGAVTSPVLDVILSWVGRHRCILEPCPAQSGQVSAE